MENSASERKAQHSSSCAAMRCEGASSKGQYFSFDAIIAAVIVVLAATSLLAYWYGAQVVFESRLSPMNEEALRISESLFSPGYPDSWPLDDISSIQYVGLSDSFSNSLNRTKVEKFAAYSNASSPAYQQMKNLLRSPSEFYIALRQTDGSSVGPYYMGKPVPANASEVAVASRGASLEGHPVSMTVYLWRQ